MTIQAVLVKAHGAYDQLGVDALAWLKTGGSYHPWDDATLVIKANGAYDFGVGEPVVNLTPPTLSGTPAVGETLTCTPGTWEGFPVPTITRAWVVDGAGVLGAYGQTFDVRVVDAGKTIACRETASNNVSSMTIQTNGIAIPDTAFSNEFTNEFN